MKAVVLKEFGPADNLKAEEIDIPEIADDEVLVKVKAISINPVDSKIRAGDFMSWDEISKNPPVVLGWDTSGVVETVGKEVNDLKKGQAVFGMIYFPDLGRAYSEYVTAKPSDLAIKPDNVSHNEAAATTLAALTAWQGLTEYGHLKKDDKILIQGASGGVGHFAVQMAKHIGAYVIGTSSGKNRDFVLSLGADEHIDYKTENFEEKLSDLDFVLETIGHANFQKSVSVLKDKGTIVNTPPGLTDEDKEAARDKDLKGSFYMSVHTDKKNIEKMADFLEKGILKPHIDKVYDFPNIKDAHKKIDTNRTVGKLIVKVE